MRDIPGYEKTYAADRQGNIWRIGAPRGRPLKPVLVNGYHRVVLSKGDIKTRFFVHQLMLLTYVGPKPEGQVPRHLNGTKTDNRLRNLAWGTFRENMADREAHGRTARGERQGNAKLTEDAVREIRSAFSYQLDYLAKKFGVSRSTIEAARYGRHWRHVIR